MGEGNERVKKIAKQQTQDLTKQYQSTMDSKTPGYIMGELNEDRTMATLVDGTTIKVICRGTPGRFAMVYKLNSTFGLVDALEPVYFGIDKTPGGGLILYLNTVNNTLLVRKPGGDSLVYTFNLAPYFSTSDYSADSNNHYSRLVAFSPNGHHICVAVARNTNIVNGKRVSVRLPNYYKNYTDIYNIGTGNTPSYNLNNPVLKYVILEKFSLGRDANGVARIVPTNIKSNANLDILTPYLNSVGNVPHNGQSQLNPKWQSIVDSSDTIDTLGGAGTFFDQDGNQLEAPPGAPLSNNGGFAQKWQVDTQVLYTADTETEADLNQLANQGVWRIRGSWSFTNTSDDTPLLEYYAFADSVKYDYTLLRSTYYEQTATSRWGFKIFPSSILDGCDAFKGYGDRFDARYEQISDIVRNTSIGSNPWRNETSSDVVYSLNANLPFALSFNCNLTFLDNKTNWTGQLTRDPQGGHCAPVFELDDCYSYNHTFTIALIPNPYNPNILENCGAFAWPAPMSVQQPVPRENTSFPSVHNPPPPRLNSSQTVPPGDISPYGGLSDFIYNCYGNAYEAFRTRGQGSINISGINHCFLPLNNDCLGNTCHGDISPGAGPYNYPQTFPSNPGGYVYSPYFTKNAIRNSSMIKINQDGNFSVLNSSGNTELQTFNTETVNYQFGPEVVTDAFYKDVAIRHGVHCSYNFTRGTINKSVFFNNTDMLNSGSYLRVFKNSGNTKFATTIAESNTLELMYLGSFTNGARVGNNFPLEQQVQDFVYVPGSTIPAPLYWSSNEQGLIGDMIQYLGVTTTPTAPPVFTDQVFFPTTPSFLAGTSIFRALDSLIFASVQTISGKRVLKKISYDPVTDTATTIKTVNDANNVTVNGTIQDVWLPI